MSDADADIYVAALARHTRRSAALVSAIERACYELPSFEPEVQLIIRNLRLALVRFNEDDDS